MSDTHHPLRTHLQTRRSVPSRMLGSPGPNADELKAMLGIAARVPDHGKLAPWRFIVVEGEARSRLGDRLAAISDRRAGDEDEQRRDIERSRFTVAPVTVVVVSRAAPHAKIPEFEQLLSAGAVCMNLLHAAHAFGFAGQWLTGWPAYDDEARRTIGLETGETVAGFVAIGTSAEPPADRPRPEIDAITSDWRG